ncbi:MAG: FeoA family protein [Sarcina sp.]
MLKLTQIPMRGEGRVIRISSEDEVREKLFSLGIKEGSIVRVVRYGANKNLTLYEVEGVMISLNKDDCEKIIVLKI